MAVLSLQLKCIEVGIAVGLIWIMCARVDFIATTSERASSMFWESLKGVATEIFLGASPRDPSFPSVIDKSGSTPSLKDVL